MSCTYIAICTEEYLPYYRELYKSIKEHSPNSRQILYYIGDKHESALNEFHGGKKPWIDDVLCINGWYENCDKSYNKLERICSLRARVVLNAFDMYERDKVIFCGAKIKFFNQPRELQRLLHDGYDAVVTPHITGPLPEDGKSPSNASVSFTGHISTDLVGFRKCPEIVKFLTWQDEIMKTKVKTTNQTYLDQSWLNFLPFFVENVKILRDYSYNVAYWNYRQRRLQKLEGNWYTGKVIEHKINPYGEEIHSMLDRLVCFQYSGLDLNNPADISTHQNRYTAEGDFLEFLKDYARKVR